MTQKEAYNLIMAEVNSQSTLAEYHRSQDNATLFLQDLSEGKFGILRMLAWSVAFIASLVSKLWERAKVEQQELADKSEPATDVYLAEKARQFRWKYDPFSENGYQIFVPADNIPTYSPEALADESSQIVKYAAAETIGGTCLVKVNGDSGGLPIALPLPSQRAAVASYIDRIKPPGSDVAVVSRSPDKITIRARIYYDPIYFEGLSTNVDSAISAFLKNLPFNGLITRNYLEDSIQAVPGVVQVVLLETRGRKAGEAPLSSQSIVFIRQYKTYAGCCIYDLPNCTIEYLPA